MKNLKTLIERIIQEEIKKYLDENAVTLKEDEMDLAKQAQSSTPDTNQETDSDTENVDTSGGGLEDLAGDINSSNNSSSGTESGGTADSSTGDDSTEGDDNSGEVDSDGVGAGGFGGSGFGSSGGGGGGSSSGGFDFGDDSDSDSDSDSEDDDTDDNNNGMPDTLESPDVDPVQAVVGMAKDLRTKTGDAQQILNSVKAAIQEKFDNYDDAATIIQLLWETNEPVLQVVARKLILFIKGN